MIASNYTSLEMTGYPKGCLKSPLHLLSWHIGNLDPMHKVFACVSKTHQCETDLVKLPITHNNTEHIAKGCQTGAISSGSFF